MTSCQFPHCFETQLEAIFVGPDAETLCKRHAVQRWQAWKVAKAQELNLDVKPAASASPFLANRKTGVKVQYPHGPRNYPVPSIWTKTKVYPYPNWRKAGLQKSYPTAQVTVLDWGKSGPPAEVSR